LAVASLVNLKKQLPCLENWKHQNTCMDPSVYVPTLAAEGEVKFAKGALGD